MEKNNFECWFAPENILAGDSYLAVIPKAISESDVFVLLLSNSSQRSFWVKSELEQAINKNISVFPIMIEECPVSEEFGFCLSHIQFFRYDNNVDQLMKQFINRYQFSSSLKSKPEPTFEKDNIYYENNELNSRRRSTKEIVALVLGWLGIFFDILIMFLFFPYVVVQTIIILVSLIIFSARKYNIATWVISLVGSICSFAIFNIVSTIILYSECKYKKIN